VTAAHIDVIASRVIPAIERGSVVILDRYWWSTWVYGRFQRVSGRFLERLIQLENLAWNQISPAVVFLVTRSSRLPQTEHTLAQRRQLEAAYRRLANREAATRDICRIKNEKSLDDAFALVLRRVAPLFPHLAGRI